jgi:hypothetical protein
VDLQAMDSLEDFLIDKVEKIGQKDPEKNEKRHDQKGFNQGGQCIAEAGAFDHAVNNGKNKNQQCRNKQNHLQGVNHARLPVINLPHHLIPLWPIMILCFLPNGQTIARRDSAVCIRKTDKSF